MKLNFLFIFFALVPFVFSTCSYYFHTLGQGCDGMNHRCYENLVCHDSTCSYPNDGADCISQDNCTSKLCENNKCVASNLSPGDSCQYGSQCTSNNCSNGYCGGIEIGQPCTGPLQCELGSFCFNNQCKESYNIGESCIGAFADTSDFMSICKGFTACKVTNSSLVDAVCTNLFSGNQGDFCLAHSHCTFGLACIANVCTPFRNDLFCDDSTGENPPGTICDCVTSTFWEIHSFGCQQELNQGLNCLNQYNCRAGNPYRSNSCELAKCPNELSSLLSCTRDGWECTFYGISPYQLSTC
ncbi:hypothetical protein M0811_01323 [Anaeramoeba ignava]|uniref:Dickkopf N-terminal cysteine-rich domain-containing protein n=1 Tax=Anaeramoeba ignava TaxID=1746090 RepID=A0A9Q0R9Q7_ANAIG|nr:hypothetical protein M0811_01323 [Anaeramoeba ignava]